MKSEQKRKTDKYHQNTCLKHNQLPLDALPDPVLIIDTEFNIIGASRDIAELYGLKEKVLHKKCYRIFHNTKKPPENCPLIKTLEDGKAHKIEFYLPTLKRYLLVTTAPLRNKNKIVGFVHSFTDITRQKQEQIHYKEIIDVYVSALQDMKTRELKTQQVRDAFFNMLEDINESYQELEDLFLKLVRVMVNALDAKSPWTKGHSERVSIYSEEIAREMHIDEDEIKDIKLAGLLHDIGKLGTYDELLDKPGTLTKEEFEIVKIHPEQGIRILEDIKQLSNVLPLIRHHHEKLDATGYPDRLEDTQIPIGAKILHVADSFDSMTSDRPYRKAPGVAYALAELEKYKGVQFDERVVEAFMRVLKKTEIGKL